MPTTSFKAFAFKTNGNVRFIICLETRDLRIVFFVRIESRIESAVYTTQAVTQPDGLQVYGIQAYNMLTTSIVNERE